MWRVSPEWIGETVYIVAGGPSVASQNTELLRDHRVIAVNLSWKRVPFADILFFADERWWRAYGNEAVVGFAGRIVTIAGTICHPRLLKIKKDPLDDRLSSDPAAVFLNKTSVTAAMNIAMHLGASRVVLLGVDGGPAADGRVHHHEEYKLAFGDTVRWLDQRADLCHAAKSLRERNIDVVNASPGSALSDVWPIVALEDHL